MPFQRTVRAANTRTSASGWAAAGGSRPALERSAVCQFTERSPSQYFAADTLIGNASSSTRTSTILLNGMEARLQGDSGHIVRRSEPCHGNRKQPLQKPATASHIFGMSRAFVKDTDADAVEDLP